MKNNSKREQSTKKRAPYEAPAIIYEGLITTRGGDSLPAPGSVPDTGAVDPSNIFKSGPGG